MGRPRSPCRAGNSGCRRGRGDDEALLVLLGQLSNGVCHGVPPPVVAFKSRRKRRRPEAGRQGITGLKSGRFSPENRFFDRPCRAARRRQHGRRLNRPHGRHRHSHHNRPPVARSEVHRLAAPMRRAKRWPTDDLRPARVPSGMRIPRWRCGSSSKPWRRWTMRCPKPRAPQHRRAPRTNTGGNTNDPPPRTWAGSTTPSRPLSRRQPPNDESSEQRPDGGSAVEGTGRWPLLRSGLHRTPSRTEGNKSNDSDTPAKKLLTFATDGFLFIERCRTT